MANYYSNLSPNDFFPLRAQNLFDPTTTPDQPYDPVSRMNELYHPREDITNLLMEQLKNIPQRDQHPGKLRTIGAILAGLGTGEAANWWGGVPVGYKANIPDQLKVQDQVLNKPYYDKLDDFNNKAKVLEAGSNIEQRNNINERTLANEVIGREIQNKREDTNAARQRATERQTDEKIKIQQQRADVYRFKAEHPTWKLVTEKGGNVYAINPQFPTMKIDTGIDSGTLSDLDKINLGLDARLEAIGAQGNETRKTENVREVNREKNIDLKDTKEKENIRIRGEESRKLKQTPSPNVSQPNNNGKKTVTVVKDKDGKVVSTREVTTEPTAREKNPQVGDVKTFPNGKKGKFDGKGWVLIG